MNKQKQKTLVSFLFFSMELYLFLLLALVTTIWGVQPGRPALIYHCLLVGIIGLELFYLYRALKYSNSYIGLPFSMLLYYQYNILGTIDFDCVFVFVIGLIVFFHLIAALSLRRKKQPPTFFSCQTILTTTLLDLATVFRFLYPKIF